MEQNGYSQDRRRFWVHAGLNGHNKMLCHASLLLYIEIIDAHRGEGGRGGMKQHPPRQIFEKLVNKMQNRWTPPGNFSLKPLTP